ncbi:activator of basal transcription 1-like [Gigantopelta aegis]|uniref:activator of basal transcription 1-like n=1 Tax=Gigantopelta aegis TaxID=1735272 RepID=UPI001B88C3DF|nr:activator of basal transcription 1-like [Gigantopelta aegis]
MESTEISVRKKRKTTPGIIYLSRIPTLMNVKKVRQVFGEFGEVDKLFLQPDDKTSSGKRGRTFSEGWVEFKDKRIAKRVALMLNNNQIGGKKRNRWYDEIWNIKYLPQFRWAHLNERLAYERAVHEQRMRTEIAQAKREASFHIENVGKGTKLSEIEKRKRKKGESIEVRTIRVKLLETEDEILAKKRKKTTVDETSRKPAAQSAGSNQSFLSKLFTAGH